LVTESRSQSSTLMSGWVSIARHTPALHCDATVGLT
jgi:hypothetical protein